MPRKHPKEDDKPAGPSQTVLAERRERRATKRARKSPDQGLENGILTIEERALINMELGTLRRHDKVETPEEQRLRESQIASLQRELELDQSCRRRKPTSIS